MDQGEIIVEERDLSFFERIFSKWKKNDEEYEEVEEAIDEIIDETEDVNELEHEYEELDEAENVIEEKRQTILTKIIEKIRKVTRPNPNDVPEEVVAESMSESIYEDGAYIVPNEIKEAMRIQNSWLKKMPNNLMVAFKNSEDYKRYQEILKKYNLIK